MNPKRYTHLTPAILAVLLASTLFLLAAAEQSTSGTITAVEENSFTLQAGDGSTLEFVTDDHTVIEGELKAGAQAEVTYRTEGDKNIAVRVRA